MSVDVTQKAYKTMPNVKSNDEAWLTWMKLLDSQYGEAAASEIFLQLWEKRGSNSANTTNLRHTLSTKYNIQVDENVFNEVADLGAGIGRTASGIFKAGKITLAVVSGVVVLATLSIIVNIIRTGQLPRNPVTPRY